MKLREIELASDTNGADRTSAVLSGRAALRRASVAEAAGATPVDGNGLPSRHFRWQGWWSRLLAAMLLVPGLPIIGLLVLLVRWASRGERGAKSRMRARDALNADAQGR